MFIKQGSTREVRCFPERGIVIKTARECLGDFGIKANIAEAYLWEKTHHPLLAPVIYSDSGQTIVMPYYSKEVSQKCTRGTGNITKERAKKMLEEYNRSFLGIAGKVLNRRLFEFFADTHDAQANNFRLTHEGKLVMIDYGISFPEHQERFEKFLDEHGAKLVAEYAEPSE